MLDLDMPFELALRGALLGAFSTGWRMCSPNVFLQKRVGREAEFLTWGLLNPRSCRSGVSAFRTPETCPSMDPSLMSPKLPSRFEPMRARHASCWIYLRAWIRLLVQMRRSDMFLQCRVLPKRLIAGWVLGATILFPPLMGGLMSSQPRRCQELLSASFPFTRVVSYVCVSAFDMVVEMRLPEKVLVTAFEFAFEGPFICMRS